VTREEIVPGRARGNGVEGSDIRGIERRWSKFGDWFNEEME
jgi:hypothetical protein